jgi:hypothetical protein
MALTTMGGGFRRDRPLTEDQWTRLLLELGEAELAESERRTRRKEPVVRARPTAQNPVESPKPERTSPKRRSRRGKEAKTELLKVRLTPEERAELEMMAGRSTLSRFVRGLLRDAGTSACE